MCKHPQFYSRQKFGVKGDQGVTYFFRFLKVDKMEVPPKNSNLMKKWSAGFFAPRPILKRVNEGTSFYEGVSLDENASIN